MTSATITCPHCRGAFELNTESIAAPLIAATRREFEEKLAQKDLALLEKQAALESEETALANRRAALDEEIAARLASERSKIAADEARKAKRLLEIELTAKDKALSEAQETIRARTEKLEEAQQVQAEATRKMRELEDAKRELDLTVEKRVAETTAAIREKASAEVDERYRLIIAERDAQTEALKRQIEDLKKRADQGSQQLQGEALELTLESQLRERFPFDTIEAIAKGVSGADILQSVTTQGGAAAGSILWESKRTKHFSEQWLGKLREDQREVKADLAVIVTAAMPKGVSTFDLIDGIYVTSIPCAIPLAIALRQMLIELSTTRKVVAGQKTKAELLYQYLTGGDFKRRVEALVEKFNEMEEDLSKERNFFTKQWNKRHAQLHAIQETMHGMRGDLQGITGNAIAEIEEFDTPLLTAVAAE